jgi:REP element-mobilizing transposase RayT
MEFKKSMSQKLRMDGRDYSRPGWYFVTMCADYHKMLFGRMVGVEMRPNALGSLAEQCWADIPAHYAHIELGAWQLMPNHFHGIVRICSAGGAGLGEVLNLFKGSVTRLVRKGGLGAGARHGEQTQHPKQAEPVRVWAPNYWDVICFEPEMLAVREAYVRANPRRWALKGVPRGRIKQSRFVGNVELLEQGPRRALRVSRKSSESEIEALREELADFSGEVCSTFFSPGERACRETLLAGSARVVWVLPMALPKAVSNDWTDAMLAGRVLWLSAFEEPEATRASCEQANAWVKRFCAAASRHGVREQEQ